MLNIKLDKIYWIQGDAHQYILVKKSKERNTNLGYYTDLKHLLMGYLDMRIRHSDIKTVQELLDFQKGLITSLNAALQPLKIRIESLEKPGS